MLDTIVIVLLEMQDQLQVFHFQTKSFAQHKALGKVYEAVAGFSDEFIETAMGKYGRFSVARGSKIILQDTSDAAINSFVENAVTFLLSLNEKLDPVNDSDLLNIRDSMLGEFNRLKYLLTLK